jgi:hypothetical protein
MQEQISDSTFSPVGINKDSTISQALLYIESRQPSGFQFNPSLNSRNLSRDILPDWYFILILLVLTGIAWARIIYGKFLNSILISAFSYQSASKLYRERNVIQKRFSLGLDLLYLITASLFVFLLDHYFSPGLFESNEILFVIEVLLFLLFLILLRIIVMRLIAFIFRRTALFQEFLYHYFIFNKVTGMLLIPLLIAIPYTQGIIQEIIVYTGISAVLAMQIFRLYRVIIFVLKNVVLLFYLILYLCILEILPVLVVIKLLLSLAQV